MSRSTFIQSDFAEYLYHTIVTTMLQADKDLVEIAACRDVRQQN
jgi:hypothetical protein